MNKNDLMPNISFNPLKILRALCLVFAFIAVITPGQFAVAQGNPDASGLFISQNVPGAQKRNEAALRHRSVQMDIGLLNNKNIRLNLFGDTEFNAERTHVKKGPEGEITWSGKLKGPDRGIAHITVFGDGVAGSISTHDGRLFEINSAPGGHVMIEEIDLDQLPPHADPITPDNGTFEDGPLDGSEAVNAPAISGDSGTLIDLMVVYTQASRVRYGESGIQTKIINAVDAMNSANAISLVDSRYRLVYMGEVNYVETGTMYDALSKLQNQTDGYMDNVHALRDQYGADIVSLIDEDSNGCGIAWVMSPSLLADNRMANWSFNVTYSGCLSNYTLAHEVGHNEGCAHDRGSSGSGSYDYSFGHTTTEFRTIMSTTCPGGSFCPRVPYFSNPNVLYNGAPTGIDHNVDPANSTDNARTKNVNETIIANWRPSAETEVPQSPNNLNLVAVSDSQIDIFWTDNAYNEEGFYVERSPNGVNSWIEIANLSANTTSHSNNGLAENTTYFYRVRSYNGVGNSSYSNTDSTSTLASNTTPTTTSAPAAPSNLTATVNYSGRGKNKTKTTTLNWTDNSENETSFIIERCEEKGKGKNKSCVFAPYVSVSANVTSFVEVPVSGTFKYRGMAVNESGGSNYSNEVKI